MVEWPFIDTAPHPPPKTGPGALCVFVVFSPADKYLGEGLAPSLMQFSDWGATIAVNMTQELPV